MIDYGHFPGEENVWKWTDGTILEDGNWARGEPNDNR